METDFPASLGDDEIVGSSQADEIDGLAGNDKLKGQAGDDILSGGPGNDTLEGGIGNDVLHGGAGFNTAVFYGAPTEYDRIRNDDNTYTVAARPGSDAHAAGYGSDVLHNIQDLQFLVFNEVIDDFQIISSSLDDVSDIADVELPDIGFGNNATFFTNYEGDADYFRVNIPTDGTYGIIKNILTPSKVCLTRRCLVVAAIKSPLLWNLTMRAQAQGLTSTILNTLTWLPAPTTLRGGVN